MKHTHKHTWNLSQAHLHVQTHTHTHTQTHKLQHPLHTIPHHQVQHQTMALQRRKVCSSFLFLFRSRDFTEAKDTLFLLLLYKQFKKEVKLRFGQVVKVLEAHVVHMCPCAHSAVQFHCAVQCSAGRTDARMRLITIVPFRLKSTFCKPHMRSPSPRVEGKHDI